MRVNPPGINVQGVTFTLANDDVPRLTGVRVYPGSDIGADSDFGRIPQLRLTPRFDGQTYEFEASATPDVEKVTVFVTGGVDSGSIEIGLKGSLEQANVIQYGNALSQAIPLADGDNVIEIRRTLHGKSTNYSVTVTRGLIPAPNFSVARGARDGGPTITVTLTGRHLTTQEMRVQVRESTTNDWPDATTDNLLPANTAASAFTQTFKDIRVTGLAKDTTYEVRAHLIELSGPVTDPAKTVVSQSSDEVQVATLSPAPAPTGLVLTPSPPGEGLSRAIAACWEAVEDGSPRMRYRLRWRKAGQSPEAKWSESGPFFQTSRRTSVLAEEGSYDVQVASDNGIDPIAWSEIKQATVNHAGGL